MTVAAAPHLVLRASSDYVNAEDTEHGVPLPFIPPLRALLRATYQDQRYTGMVEWRMAAPADPPRRRRHADGRLRDH